MVSFNNSDTLSFINKISTRHNLDGNNTTLTKDEIKSAIATPVDLSQQEIKQLRSLLTGDSLNKKADASGDQFIGQFELARFFNENPTFEEDVALKGTNVSAGDLTKPGEAADAQVLKDLETINGAGLDAVNGNDDVIGINDINELKDMSQEKIKEKFGEDKAKDVSEWRDAYVRLDSVELSKPAQDILKAESGGEHKKATDVLFSIAGNKVRKERDGRFNNADAADTRNRFQAIFSGIGPGSVGGLVQEA
ncbi:hypothetical protein [Vampirovibrio sp.]|uniref:hypothetical protein n=1 Tax=Vampirovibrio sp. TaxID=2717857 RepID=UPI003593715A